MMPAAVFRLTQPSSIYTACPQLSASWARCMSCPISCCMSWTYLQACLSMPEHARQSPMHNMTQSMVTSAQPELSSSVCLCSWRACLASQTTPMRG